MSDALGNVLPGLVPLGVVAVVALVLTVHRGPGRDDTASRTRLVRWIVLAIALQSVHFTEELLGEFHLRYPPMLGLQPWSTTFFVSFNLGWIATWILSAIGVARRSHTALFPIWFLAIACVLNGVAHPALALLAGGYFPGLWTALPLGVLGVQLLRLLQDFTRPFRTQT